MADAAHIFICYAGPDRAIAERLHGALRGGGLMPWCDAIDPLPYEAKDAAKQSALRRAAVVAVLVSHHWPVAGEKGSDYQGPEDVAWAIEFARQHGTKLVPVRLDGVGRDRVPYGLVRAIGIDARSDALDRVVVGLRRSMAATDETPPEPPPTDPLARAEHQRALREREGASAKVLAALDKRILNLKRGRLHRHRPEPGLDLDRWFLIEKLGRGGFAEVWAAEDVQTSETVALKILHAQFDDSAERRARFFRGAARMARLDHPHIARVIAPEVEDKDRHFFAMELLAGGDLDKAVRAGRVDRVAGLRCVIRIAQAVAAAHDAGLIHRDIKPANILLDAGGAPKLTDFDLVWAGDTTGGTRTTALGTFIYGAPEAMEDAGRVDPRCDVYGLGMTALFVLLGKPLTRRMVRKPEKVLAAVEGFERVKSEILKAIDWEPEERHPTAGTFAAAMRDALRSGRAARPSRPTITPTPLTSRASFARLRDVTPIVVSAAHHGEIHRARAAGPQPGDTVAPATAHRPALVYIPAGEFAIGSPTSERGRGENKPQRSVRLTRPVWLAATPVTAAQYWTLVRSAGRGTDELPVTRVSWLDAVAFCNALSSVERLEPSYVGDPESPRLVSSANGYRLPTEAEWEHACRAGTTTRFWSGDAEADLADVGWFAGNSGRTVHPVGEKHANPWGLYDMHGNVWEWCQDWHAPYAKSGPTAPLVDPTGPPTGGRRVLRGGSCFVSADYCRSALRSAYRPGHRGHGYGFRLARPVPALRS